MNGIQPRDAWYESGGLRLHGLEWGGPPAPAMVLLHGTASHAHLWDHFARVLAPEYYIVAPDQRGHGDSEAPADYRTGYPADIWVQDIKAIVDAMRLAPIVLVGVSAGGNTAIHYAARFPADVARLVVVEMGPEAARAGVERVISSIPAQEEFDSLDEGIAYLTRSAGRADPALARDHALHALRPTAGGRYELKGDPALRRRDWRRPLRTAEENWRAVHSVQCPTLLVRGSESRLLAPETAERMRNEMRDCTLVTIEGAGHAVPLHRPEAFAAAVSSWLTERA